MHSYRDRWEPMSMADMIWRSLALLLLGLLWFIGDNGHEGLILLLVLVNMTLARWRFSWPTWTTLIDLAVCTAVMPLWPEASYGLALPLFEAMRAYKPLFVLPIAVVVVAFAKVELLLLVVLIQAMFAGGILHYGSKQLASYRREADSERRDRYELESLKEELLLANMQTAHFAELTERNRISLKLHDDVGHELTAALLALQAYEQLRKEGDLQAGSMLEQAMNRLRASSWQLRETVHDLKPARAIGVAHLEEICRNFQAFPVKLHVYGDTSEVPAYLWIILASCLKEALTNIVRHSKAKHVEVSLDSSEHLIRLSVHNDGVTPEITVEPGIGLRNLRQRAQAVGGSISMNHRNGFQLICVLPIRKERLT
ncbi:MULTISPECIES: sensor histidine kinase [Paenibacillus]|uniref:histidine kinase n=1 Tax=Paenibacillus campinasensis TaxID=66347 RepID=A0A268EQA5_9BACL|nr:MULTISPECIES: histidine kinase [Paenibacillus]PAD75281.1 two-component sensor histidine kinase [Paenibacillus campinasensis]PAK55820.1 two-component sensor histidine kinase [Paenibacillus sp. 7541]